MTQTPHFSIFRKVLARLAAFTRLPTASAAVLPFVFDLLERLVLLFQRAATTQKRRFSLPQRACAISSSAPAASSCSAASRPSRSASATPPVTSACNRTEPSVASTMATNFSSLP